MIKQLPLTYGKAQKSDVRTQFAALCYRIKANKVQVLLITSRRSGRWILPKGWPIDGKTPSESAAQEAWEEAGVVGHAEQRPLGLYAYTKITGPEDGLPCVAMVYPVRVKALKKDFPEAGQRKRKWVSRKKAAAMVGEPELARILRDFDPRAWH
ncbi:NUDIX hydrolase [Tateyamaria sp. SN6-1]|uniref:NUDIX hydrolase n=1 Tax=Tateyamaria sp. SN6-1 TaxID=3092148 RepID=UPI0039F62B28